MRVLWIEDFGGDVDALSLLEVVFSEVVFSQRLDALGSVQGRGRENERPQGYDEWRDWYDKQPATHNPEIDIYRKSSHFYELIKSGFLIERYDVVLLDINLENNFFGDKLDYPASEGGFWLYNKLVRAGFPSERIALLTAHSTEKATTEFVAGCERYGHEELRTFGKTSSDAGQWVSKLASDNDGFINMRRGVLDGVVFIEKSLSCHGEDAIRFNTFVSPDNTLSFDQAFDYLETTRHLLPVRVSGAQLASQLRGFRYLLACEWDRALPRFGSCQVYKSVGKVMKCLRNWSSHGHLLDGASVGDIAFFALIGLRSGFLIPDARDHQLHRYEHRLLGVLNDEVGRDELPKRLARSYVQAKVLLENLVGMPSKLMKDRQPVVHQNRSAFVDIVNELTIAIEKPTGFDFPTALREMLIQLVIMPDGFKFDVGRVDYLNEIELQFAREIDNKWNEVPCWLKASFARI